MKRLGNSNSRFRAAFQKRALDSKSVSDHSDFGPTYFWGSEPLDWAQRNLVQWNLESHVQCFWEKLRCFWAGEVEGRVHRAFGPRSENFKDLENFWAMFCYQFWFGSNPARFVSCLEGFWDKLICFQFQENNLTGLCPLHTFLLTARLAKFSDDDSDAVIFEFSNFCTCSKTARTVYSSCWYSSVDENNCSMSAWRFDILWTFCQLQTWSQDSWTMQPIKIVEPS